MSSWIATILTCWCCVLLATPRRPLPGNEVEELVYTRLLGRQHLLILVAALVTAATVVGLVVTLPQRLDSALAESRRLNQYCAAAAAGQPLCYRLAPDGQWSEAALQSEGEWVVVGTVLALPTVSTPMTGSPP